MRESSRLLHQSTDGRAYFRSVTVIVPSSWSTVDWAATCRRNITRTRLGSYANAEVRVSATAHPLFTGGADAVWTQQSRDCGQQGDYISAGPEFFFKLDSSNPSSDAWIKGDI